MTDDRLHPDPVAHLPAAARHRHPRGPRRAAVVLADAAERPPTCRSSATRPPSSTTRGREDLDEGLADGVPRGGHPGGRRPHHLRHRRPLDPRRARPPDEIKAFHNVCPHRGRRPEGDAGRATRAALRVPRLRLGARRLPQAGALPVGLPPTRARRVVSLPEVQGRHLGRLRVRQPRPRLRTARGAPRRSLDSTSSAGRSRTATRRPTSPRSWTATGRWRRRPSWRPSTWWRPTRSSCRAWATPSPSTTSSATSVGRSPRTARRAPTSTGCRPSRRCSTP